KPTINALGRPALRVGHALYNAAGSFAPFVNADRSKAKIRHVTRHHRPPSSDNLRLTIRAKRDRSEPTRQCEDKGPKPPSKLKPISAPIVHVATKTGKGESNG